MPSRPQPPSLDDLFIPMPPILKLCERCKVTESDVVSGQVVISPRGIAHHGADFGMTDCGRDASRLHWWWPC